MDITQVILDDHHEQRRQFAMLEEVDRADTATLSALWQRLATHLEVHAAAEEEILYPVLLRVGISAGRQAGVEGETLDAIDDHNEIRDAIAAVARCQVGSDEWVAAVDAANLANSDHMAEEEREGLTDFRRLVGLQQRHELAVAMAAYEAANFTGIALVDKDPASYVREAEQGADRPGRSAGGEPGQAPAARDGSLRIGSLRQS